MAKTKSQNKGGWIKMLCCALVCLVVGGAITFGVIKLVDHYKTVKPNDKEQTEKVPVENEGGEKTPEEKIATANVEKYIA